MILLLTNSKDATANALCPLLSAKEEVFRFNLDQWREYGWNITRSGYELVDKEGVRCLEGNVTAAFAHSLLFQPERIDVPASGNAETWNREAAWRACCIFRDVARQEGRLAFASREPMEWWNPERQSRLASRWFEIPQSQYLYRFSPALAGEIICKSLCRTPVVNQAINRAAVVQPGMVNVDDQWFLQQRIPYEAELSIFCIQGVVYPFGRCAPCGVWREAELSDQEKRGVASLMEAADFPLAQLHFLRTAKRLVFLSWSDELDWAGFSAEARHALIAPIAEEILNR